MPMAVIPLADAMISRVAIIGGGLMGHGIALSYAHAGHTVRVQDPSSETRDSLPARIAASMQSLGHDENAIKQAQSNVTAYESLSDALDDAELVIEAAPEKLELKQALFAEIEKHVSDACLLASNTSVLPITRIMENLQKPDRALGTHWWNPPHFIPLVEVIRTPHTSDAAMDAVFDSLSHVGKRPVRVEKDVPGFIGNRLQHALWREAISIVENGICDAEAVDTVVKESFGRRLAVLGPLENADLVGTGLTLDIHSTVLADLERRPGPSPYLQQLVDEDKAGMASGTGFRHWTPESAQAVRDRLANHLKKLDSILEQDST